MTSGIMNMHNNSTSDASCKGSIDLEFYRKMVKQLCAIRRYETALFWAEKVCCLTQNDPKDVYYQAQCMFLMKEYHRAAHLIRLHKLEKTNVACYSLLLESLYEAKAYSEALTVINTVDIDYLMASLINHPTDNSKIDYYGLQYFEDSRSNELMASVNFLKGKIYEAMDNRGMAMDCYVQALHKSVYMFEAMEALVQHEMLMPWEEKELMGHLPWDMQLQEADTTFVTALYETKLKKYYDTLAAPTNTGDTQLKENEQTPPVANISNVKSIKELNEKIQNIRSSDVSIYRNLINKYLTPESSNKVMSPANKVLQDIKVPSFCLQLSLNRASSMINETERSHFDSSRFNRMKDTTMDQDHGLSLSLCMERIQKSTDVMASEAEKLFYDCDYKKSSQILNELLKIDPHHHAALTIQIGCLVEFGDYNKLFYVAHKLVDRYPDMAISWYAVGCYYDLIGKSDPARRYFAKATNLDRLYGPAWLAYGHSFAKENEHDQAMAAYFKATQLMRGCHLPLLYIGVECGLTKNLELAEKFFYQSMSIAPLDVFVMHELGVIKYEYEFYESAEEVLKATVEMVSHRAKRNNEEISVRWEPLFNNLGHCCRKNKKYSEAIEYHQRALLLKPQSSSTYTSIGFLNALMGNLEEAITYFHKSLALNRDCIVTSTILKTCIEDYMDRGSIMENIYSKTLGNKIPYKLPKVNNLFPAIVEEEASATSSMSITPMNMGTTMPIKLTATKLKFDEEDISATSDSCDPNADVNMDT